MQINKRMKKFSILFLTLCLGCFAEVSAQHMVTIKGKGSLPIRILKFLYISVSLLVRKYLQKFL